MCGVGVDSGRERKRESPSPAVTLPIYLPDPAQGEKSAHPLLQEMHCGGWPALLPLTATSRITAHLAPEGGEEWSLGARTTVQHEDSSEEVWEDEMKCHLAAAQLSMLVDGAGAL